MIEQIKIFEVEDSFFSDHIYAASWLSITTIGPIAYLVWVIIFPPLLDFRVMAIFGILFLLEIMVGCPNLKKVFFIAVPKYRVKCFISDEEIIFYIQNRPYLKFFWKDIKKIELLKEKCLKVFRYKENSNYRLNIITNNKSIIVRLFILRFRKKSRELIISALKQYSKALKKDFIRISEINKLRLNELNEEIDQILNFKNRIKTEEGIKFERGLIITYIVFMIVGLFFIIIIPYTFIFIL
ncbi:MAG: hypothetical protein ACTSPQ_18910 [Candidatus Helarchaeota archaeon]